MSVNCSKVGGSAVIKWRRVARTKTSELPRLNRNVIWAGADPSALRAFVFSCASGAQLCKGLREPTGNQTAVPG
jgi:hypothetical protein